MNTLTRLSKKSVAVQRSPARESWMCSRQTGIAEATFYLWKKKYGSLGAAEVRELRQMREENARLKRVVADLTLDKHILQEVLRKKD